MFAKSIYVYGVEILKIYKENNVIFSPKADFSDLLALYSTGNKQGVLIDNISPETVFKDAGGSQPAISDGDPVGLVLDKSRGLAKGPELVINGNFANSDISSITDDYIAYETGALRVILSGSGNYLNNLDYMLKSGKTYLISFELLENNITAGGWSMRVMDGGDESILLDPTSALGTYQKYFRPKADSPVLLREFYGAGNILIDNISIKEVYGNNVVQTVSAERPLYKTNPSRIVFDEVDDSLNVEVPAGGWVGTMIVATTIGTASYGVNIPAGNFSLSKSSSRFDTDVVGILIRNGGLTEPEKIKVENYFVANGAKGSYNTTTSFFSFWRNCSEITDFPLINISSGIDFSYAWCNCTSLIYFPANMFDNVKTGNFNNAFENTKLSQTSIDNILSSLVTSGIATGTRIFYQSGGSAPSIIGMNAIDILRSRGWTITVTGEY